MLKLGSELKGKREKLSKRAKRYYKYQVLTFLCMSGGYAVFVVLASGSFAQILPTKAAANWIGTLSLLLGMSLGVIANHLGKSEKPSYEEVLFLDVCSALDELAVYVEDEREQDRKRAEKKVAKISKKIEEWNVGLLLVFKNAISPHLDPFKEAFYTKIVGAVRQREKDDFIHAYRILKTFAKYLTKSEPEIEYLDLMTKAMHDVINVTIPSRIATQKRLFRHLKGKRIQHIGVITISLVIGYSIGHIGYYVVQVPIEYAYTMSVTVGLGIILGYFNYLRK